MHTKKKLEKYNEWNKEGKNCLLNKGVIHKEEIKKNDRRNELKKEKLKKWMNERQLLTL